MKQEQIDILTQTAQLMVADNKGLLAMDESLPTCHKRFEKLGIPQTEAMRRKYRELILTAPDLNKYISGVILFDETTRQTQDDGTPFMNLIADAGIIPGIKVDKGAKDLPEHPGEKITEGLDGLAERLEEYRRIGARFAKWRAVITIDAGVPTQSCIEANAHALARYAGLCQQAGIVPIIEPEVLMDGSHTLEECYNVTEITLKEVFHQLYQQRILLEGMILKPNMVLPGNQCEIQNSVDEVAHSTITCFLRSVPAAVPGIAFLSGGQSAADASARLNAMNVHYKSILPWGVAFSFSRAIQQPALDFWKGKEENVSEAQKILVHHAYCNYMARRGEYNQTT